MFIEAQGFLNIDYDEDRTPIPRINVYFLRIAPGDPTDSSYVKIAFRLGIRH